jgi:hypothetical protein
VVDRWRDLFDVLLYDLTGTYFEAEPGPWLRLKRWHRLGHVSRRRSSCLR